MIVHATCNFTFVSGDIYSYMQEVTIMNTLYSSTKVGQYTYKPCIPRQQIPYLRNYNHRNM